MNRDEQKAITQFIEGAIGGDAPPMDVEADAIIRALFVRNPEAAYRVTMLAMAKVERPRETVRHSVPARRRWLPHVWRRGPRGALDG